jgi:hypothetical protein
LGLPTLGKAKGIGVGVKKGKVGISTIVYIFLKVCHCSKILGMLGIGLQLSYYGEEDIAITNRFNSIITLKHQTRGEDGLTLAK